MDYVPARVAVINEVPALRPRFERLKKRLEADTIKDSATADFLLALSPEGLELREVGGTTKPLHITFEGLLKRRRRKIEPVARAVGLKGELRPRVLDLTAGLAQDAFMLASYGCNVQLIERSPVIAALLEDGLERAQAQPALASIVARMSLRVTEARDFLSSAAFVASSYDALYLDPMYPETGKSAAKGKEMQFFRALVGSDLDAPDLLGLALQSRVRRVVVKRPLKAPPLGARPDASLKGKTTRFDLYFR